MNLISVYGTLKLASLCQSVMDLAASNLTSLSPSVAISAVSSLAHEHSQLREKLASTNEQLEEVSVASNSIVAELIQIGLMTQLYIHIFLSYIYMTLISWSSHTPVFYCFQCANTGNDQILEAVNIKEWGNYMCIHVHVGM